MYTCLKSELSYYTWQYWDIQEMMVTIVAWLDLSWTIDKSFIGIALLIEIELDVITLLFGFLKLLFLWRFQPKHIDGNNFPRDEVWGEVF